MDPQEEARYELELLAYDPQLGRYLSDFLENSDGEWRIADDSSGDLVKEGDECASVGRDEKTGRWFAEPGGIKLETSSGRPRSFLKPSAAIAAAEAYLAEAPSI